jgi:hypothetical protein
LTPVLGELDTVCMGVAIRARGVVLLWLAASLAGCGDGIALVGDAGVDARAVDAGRRPPDATHPDATLPDAFTPPDAATPNDAFTSPDATLPDAFTSPDAALSPDAWPPYDATCAAPPGSTTIVLHSVAPDPVAGGIRDLAHVHVHAESGCGTDMQLQTDATGHLTLDLPNAGAPWAVTLALAGYAAVSVLDITTIAFEGDVRLDPITPTPAPVTYLAQGTVGGIAAGNHATVDCFDSGTGTEPTAPFYFYSHFQVGEEAPNPPLQFVALEWSPSPLPTLLNIGSTGPMTRPAADLPTAITIAMSSPPPTPVVSHVVVHLPTTGITAPASNVNAFPAQHALFDLPNAPTMVTGALDVRQHAYPVPDFDIAITHFPGPWDVNRTGLWATAAPDTWIDVNITDITDHEVTVPPVTELTATGTSFDTLAARATGAGYDLLVLSLGEGMYAPRPRWRVYATTSSGAARIDGLPHLPSAVTLADIGLGAATTSFVTRYVRMHTGRGWTTEGLWAQVCCGRYGGAWQQAWSVSTGYSTISTAGR